MANPLESIANAITGNNKPPANNTPPAAGTRPEDGKPLATTGNDLPLAPDKPPTDGKKAKVYRYRCVVNCVRDGKYRRKGDIIVLPEKQDVPHFELIEDEGNN